MSTEGELVSMVQDWMGLEKEIKNMQGTLRELRLKQKAATARLVLVMKEHEIDCLDVKDGRLSHRTMKSRGTVSKKHLLSSIASFFENADDPELSAKLTGHILETRGVKLQDKISLRRAK
tara:strand:+ start:627 stop:986 length:360 start_codon:yes stop_codon:yes gene_type:complete